MLKAEAMKLVHDTIVSNSLQDSSSYELNELITQLNQEQIEGVLKLLEIDGVVTVGKRFVHGLPYSLNRG